MQNLLVYLFSICILISCEEGKNYSFENYFQSDKYKLLDLEQKNEKLDSIFESLNVQNRDSITNENFLLLSTEYYYTNNNEKSKKAALEALDISIENNDSLKHATSLYYIAETYQKEIKDSAYFYFISAREIYNDIGEFSKVAKMQFNIAHLLFYEGNYIDCEVKLVDALKKSEGEKNIFRYSYLNLMGNCQEKLLNFNLALKYHNEALTLLKDLNRNDIIDYKTASIINICNLYDINNDYDKTINILSKFNEDENLKKYSVKSYSEVKNNIAYAKMKKGDLNGLEKDFLEVLEIAVNLGLVNEILYRKVNLGEYYLTVGNLSKSKTYFKESLSLSKQIGNYNEYLKTLKFLAKVDIQNKDFYNDEYVHIKDSITTAQLTNREKYARIEYETSKLEEENEKLTQQNLIILLTTLFVTTLFLLIVFYLKLNSQKKENKLLSDKQNAEREMLTLLEENRNNVEKAKIKEQNRISKELHDGILNDLYGVRLNLDYIFASNDYNNKDETDSYIESLFKVENDIRKISHELKIEEKFEKSEFKNLMCSLVEEKNELYKIKFKCEIDDKIDWYNFTTSDKLNIYRIIQEATQNVVKHSKAHNCNISFKMIKGEIIIVIEDDGVGFDLEKDKDGIGLKNIKERVNDLGGVLNIKSSIKGTTIILSLNNSKP